MYRRYRIFQHSWPRILPIFTIKWKLKSSLVKLIKSFLQFCISHQFKIHFYLCTWSLYLEGIMMSIRGCSRDRFLVTTDLPCSALFASPPRIKMSDVPRVSLLFLIIPDMTPWRDWSLCRYRMCHHTPHTDVSVPEMRLHNYFSSDSLSHPPNAKCKNIDEWHEWQSTNNK